MRHKARHVRHWVARFVLVRLARTWEEKVRQQVLDFGKDEMRQLQANMRHWGMRLESLGRELEEEPARIRAGYEVRARRVEPVGLVYLWPVSS